jgi:hypothetical protein
MMDYWLRPPATLSAADLEQKRNKAKQKFARLTDAVLMTASSELKGAAEVMLKVIQQAETLVKQPAANIQDQERQELQTQFDNARTNFINAIRARRSRRSVSEEKEDGPRAESKQ